MSEKIHEKVSVVTVFDRKNDKVMPWSIKWQGRTYHTTRVGLHYPVRHGRKLVHYFSVMTDQNVALKLQHDTETLHWILEEVVDDGDAVQSC